MTQHINPAPKGIIPGQQFGLLTAVREAGRNPRGKVLWECRCQCGEVRAIVRHKLLSGHTRSCGCLRMQSSIRKNFRDITGKQYGRLTVLRWAGAGGAKRGGALWECKCSCGKVVIVSRKTLLNGHTRSCGCYKSDCNRQACLDRDSWSEGMKEELRRRYPSEGAGPFARDHGLTKKQVTQKAFWMGLESMNWRENMRKAAVAKGEREATKNTSVNWRYFETWTPNMAWMLGYIWADGSISDDSLRFKCRTEDEELLVAIKEDLSSEHRLVREPPFINKHGRRIGPMTRLIVSSTLLIKCLMERHGILPNKTDLDLPYPEVPSEYLCHFARGNLDGDGCVHWSPRKPSLCSIIFGGQPRFMAGLQQAISKQVGIPALSLQVQGPKLTSFSWSARVDITKLHQWLYPPGAYIYLARKRKTLEHGLSIPVIGRRK